MLLTLLLHPSDQGPVYRETTDLSLFIVEPWNAWSSLTFLIPACFFLWQLRGRFNQHAFIVYFCVPLLILGGFGSTFFHAFRSSRWLLLLDVLPIVLLVLGISVWMWLKVLPRKIWLLPILLVFFGLSFLLTRVLAGQDGISAGYIVRGTMLLLPCYLFLRRSGFRNAGLFSGAVASFAMALVFRFTDDKIQIGFMPWGTHWLWHVSTAIGAYFLGEYLINHSQERK